MSDHTESPKPDSDVNADDHATPKQPSDAPPKPGKAIPMSWVLIAILLYALGQMAYLFFTGGSGG